MEMHTAGSLLTGHAIAGQPGERSVSRTKWLLNLVLSAACGVVRWQQHRRNIGELQRLDDRLLADIGISRADIPAVVAMIGGSLLVGAGEEQDTKEAYLAYWTLRRADQTMSKAEIDHAAEAFLRERFGLQLNFEIHDALAKLERLGLVTREGERYSALAPPEALACLDAAWDGLFHFSARRG